MTRSARNFLLGLSAVYLVLAIGLNVFLGPPSLSSEYLESGDNRAEHDRYLVITKSPEYKLWKENPEVHPPDETLQEQIAFVGSYEARPAFQAEMRRRFWYGLTFDFLHTATLILLAVRFGKAPLRNYLDRRVSQVADDIHQAKSAVEAAEARLATARDHLEGLSRERIRLMHEASQAADVERAMVQESTDLAVAQLEQELEDRKRLEQLLGQRAVRKTLVNAALKEIEQRYSSIRSAETENELIEAFTRELEGRR